MIQLILHDPTVIAATIREITVIYEARTAEDISIEVTSDLLGVRASAKDTSVHTAFIEKSTTKTAKTAVYLLLREITAIELPWGCLTGVKPLNKLLQLTDGGRSVNEAASYLAENFYVSKAKLELLIETAMVQQPYLHADKGTAGLYIHIPLCVSKCTYCSFPSKITSVGSSLCEDYLSALLKELARLKKYNEAGGISFDSVYIGGGTPSVLSEAQLCRLMDSVLNIAGNCPEITLEAGRCDTLSAGKLHLLKQCGVTRISLNPQTTNNATLAKINRNASYEDFLNCYETAAAIGFDAINCDLILGLEDETEEDFAKSLSDVMALSPDNITLHTLCRKHSADMQAEQVLSNRSDVSSFHDKARAVLREAGYLPYYLYKQKYALTGSENVGYARAGKECVYNIRMMGYRQTIFSAGAGSSSKIVDPISGNYRNVYNIKEVPLYISSIDDVIEKKFKAIALLQNNAEH